MSSSSSATSTTGRLTRRAPARAVDDATLLRQLEPEDAAAARAPGGRDPAAVRLDDRSRDEQPEAGAGDLRADRAGRAVEAFEDALLLAGLDSDSRVEHLDRHVRRCVRSTRSSTTPRSERELDPVRDEVVEELEEAAAVAPDRGRPFAVERERHVLLLGAGAHLEHRLLADLDDVDLLERQLQLTGLQTGREQQVVDEPQQPVGAPRDDLEEAAALGVERRAVLVERELDVADDRRERRAQVVGDERDELVLQPVGLDEPCVLLDELAPCLLGTEPCHFLTGADPLERAEDAGEPPDDEECEHDAEHRHDVDADRCLRGRLR